ncbi:MAG TPA: glycosyltransferase [archaeon]|nr:glycosyltransferase [archaeon]
MKIVTMMLTLNSENFFKKGVLDALTRAAMGYDHQLIVVDGGSSDGTLDAIRQKFGDKSKIIQYTMRNLAACRNTALLNAPKDADFYCWIDSDIIIPENFFFRLLPLFKDSTVGTAEIRAVLEFDPPRSIVGRYYRELKMNQEKGVKVNGGGATVCSVMRPELAKILHFDNRFRRAGEDLDSHWQAVEKGYKTILDLNDPLAIHVRKPSVIEELKRIKDRGIARALNLLIHKKVIKNRGISGTLAASVITLASWVLFVYGILAAYPLALLPLVLLLIRQMLKLRRFWRIDLAVLGLLLSLFYLAGFTYGFLKYWLPWLLTKRQ